MSDANEIDSLIAKNDHQEFPTFTNKQLSYVEDSNNGNYASGAVRIEPGNTMKTVWSTLSEGYILMPISVAASSGTALTAASLIACKQSVLSFINSVMFTASNTQIINETDINIINNLKLLNNFDYEFQKEYGAELQFAKDSSTQSTTAAANTGILNDVSVNAGLNQRVQFFKQSSQFANGVFSTVVKIPLRFIHDIFKSMDFPLINFDYKFQFGLNMYQNQSFAPMVKDVSANATNGLTCTIGTGLIPGSLVSLNKVRLYYHTVTFDGHLNEKLAMKLQSGFTKKVFYTITDTYLPQPTEIGVSSGTISRILSSAIEHPLRVWIVAVPTLALSV